MKIEQQEISTKQNCKCENTNLVKELYILNKVKEAKINSSKEDFNSGKTEIRYNYFESLILAQDERWRRA